MWQEVVIMESSACGKSKTNIIARLTGYSTKFSSSKSLMAPLVKISHYPTFAPYDT